LDNKLRHHSKSQCLLEFFVAHKLKDLLVSISLLK
jgi:hypothetical protein